MWCTRWYLPLVLLPFPIAPPYFLWLFIFSTTLHARPCFYCIVLLSALFMSSCYWPPAPLDTPLTVPWSEEITTFQDALFSVLPNLPDDLVPTDVPMLDRCWCDLSGTGLFEHFNTTEWELRSVLRLKERLEPQVKEREAALAPVTNPHGIDSTPHMAGSDNSTVPVLRNTESRLSTLWVKVASWPFSRRPPFQSAALPSKPVADDPSSAGRAEYPPVGPGSVAPSSVKGPSTPLPAPLALFRREYDLRPYGFAMIVDFGWTKGGS